MNAFVSEAKSKAEFCLSNLEDRIGNRGAVLAPKRIRIDKLENFNLGDQSSLEREFLKAS